jgi:hypothetical protein
MGLCAPLLLLGPCGGLISHCPQSTAKPMLSEGSRSGIDILLSIPSSMSAIVKVKENLFIRCRFNQNTTNKKIVLHLHPPLLLCSPVLPPPHSAAPLRCLSAPHPHASSRAVPELTLAGQTAPATPPYARARVASPLRSADCLAPHPNLPRPCDPVLTGAAGPRATAAGRRPAPLIPRHRQSPCAGCNSMAGAALRLHLAARRRG